MNKKNRENKDAKIHMVKNRENEDAKIHMVAVQETQDRKHGSPECIWEKGSSTL